MPFTVQQLIVDRQHPQTVSSSDQLQRALEMMAEHDFSQLPVVDAQNKPIGLISSDSILRALNHFSATIVELRVSDAMARAVTKRNDEDLFDLLDDLRDVYAILIVDGDGALVGIVTNYDTTEYFRRRTQDIMFVQDVETMLKDFVFAAFANTASELDSQALEAAITDIMPSDKELRKKFRKALCRYLELSGEIQPHPQQEWLDEAFTQHLEAIREPRPVERLTLYDYTELFLHERRWSFYRDIFSLKPAAIRRLLDPVRETRNALAHLREITPKQREQLRFCKEWLAGHQPPLPKPLPGSMASEPQSDNVAPIESPLVPVETPLSNEIDDLQPVEEMPVPGESRYEQLARWLQKQSRRKSRVELTFREVEEIIGFELPASARRHRAWWANDSVSHSWSISWLSADWRVAGINMSEERVDFAPMREREKAYIEFFSSLVAELTAASSDFYQSSPTGLSWIGVRRLAVEKRTIAQFVYSFTRDGRFRVELYIDSGNAMLNESMFFNFEEPYRADPDTLWDLIGEKVSWERLPGKRACRIAVYHPGSIMSPAPELAALRRWAVPMMIRFYQTFGGLDEVVKDWLLQENSYEAQLFFGSTP